MFKLKCCDYFHFISGAPGWWWLANYCRRLYIPYNFTKNELLDESFLTISIFFQYFFNKFWDNSNTIFKMFCQTFHRHHWHYTTMTVSYEPIKINPFLTPCQPPTYCAPPSSSVFSISYVRSHVHMPAHSPTSLMCVKKTSRHFCLLHLLSGTLERRKWKKDKKHQIKWL